MYYLQFTGFFATVKFKLPLLEQLIDTLPNKEKIEENS